MLQQTQTSRVVQPWRRFLERFPTAAACAASPLDAVLLAWAGLGFHRRARFLHETARAIVTQHGGEVPQSVAALRALPGIGPYTANAIASFAFGAPVGILDTNVGRVLARAVTNRPLKRTEAQALVDYLVPQRTSAAFNQALLDVGAQFCSGRPRCVDCPLAPVCRWRREGGDDPAPTSAGVSKPQASFAGSDRQIRGRILAHLRLGPSTWALVQAASGSNDRERVQRCAASLVADGLAYTERGRWHLGQ